VNGTATGTTGRNTVGTFPGNNPTTNPGLARPIFLSGKVMFDDGRATNSDIRIERVCGGNPRLEAHTDSKGRFSFQVGQNQVLDTDAADTWAGNSSGSSYSRSQLNGASSLSSLWNCQLRASYPGYQSELVELGSRQFLDDPNVGTIVLHHLGNVQGTTISATSAMAPKRAQKDYDKGMQLASKGNFDEAEKRLLSATDLYPKYAIAWFALGQMQQKQGKTEAAEKSYQSAISADSHYTSPYEELAMLSAQANRWQDAADYSKKLIELNPVEFPRAFWCNALANYNLKKEADAEKSAKELLKLDVNHKFPDAERLYAQLLIDRGDFADAASHLRQYLVLQPRAPAADGVRQTLAKLDDANRQAKK
jgi:tetratricopeptide (TPR) repeat protein